MSSFRAVASFNKDWMPPVKLTSSENIWPRSLLNAYSSTPSLWERSTRKKENPMLLSTPTIKTQHICEGTELAIPNNTTNRSWTYLHVFTVMVQKDNWLRQCWHNHDRKDRTKKRAKETLDASMVLDNHICNHISHSYLYDKLRIL